MFFWISFFEGWLEGELKWKFRVFVNEEKFTGVSQGLGKLHKGLSYHKELC